LPPGGGLPQNRAPDAALSALFPIVLDRHARRFSEQRPRRSRL